MSANALRLARFKWGVVGIMLVLAFAIFGNRADRERLDHARRVLAASGYTQASVGRAQSLKNMARCKVGQIRNRGFAYGWETKTKSGVLCYPEDGRPVQILVDQP